MRSPTFSFSPAYLTGTSAWTGHLPFAYDLMKVIEPAIFVELGTWNGDSFFTFCQSVAENHLSAVCYAVDLWTGDEQTGTADSAQFSRVQSYCASNYQGFAYLMRTDFASASKEFSDAQIGMLHIDGLHTYDAVSEDFAAWFPKVREGGIVLFHDISVRSSTEHLDFGVWKFWDEIKLKHRTFQFNHGCGLGILVKGENPDAVDWLTNAMDEYRFYYSTRGADMQRIGDGVQAMEHILGQAAYINNLHQSIATLKSTITETEQSHRAAQKCIDEWNRRPWFHRALHKIRIRH
ncbi:MAG: class I SAM-dependent methyltransferase [Chthoniobacteraceae bacterium]